MSQHELHEGERSASAAYETRDVKVRPLAVFLVGLAVFALVAYLIVLGIFRLFNAQKVAEDAQADPVAVQRSALPPEQRLPAEPRIQADPAGDLQRLRAAEDRILSTYGWIDREAGTIHMPITAAMEAIVREGLPHRATAPAAPTPAPDAPPTAPAARSGGR